MDVISRERAEKSRSKILALEKLAERLKSLRTSGQKVVLCHGVFDLLHIGHIRHLEEAKKIGDVLVVTVTPDRFVNKGPHRPAFVQDLRAEAIASLSCVDFVAVNQWPMAVETIQLLRPDFYVKGSDYQESKDDHTGGILLEEAAVRAVGGTLVFTDDIAFSSSSLINRHFSAFPEPVRDYLSNFASRYSASDVIQILKGAQSLKVLVIGESIIDEYQYCDAIGKSSKEPMLALKHLVTEKFAGGILAVGNHVANFCDHVGLITQLGDRQSQEEFILEKLNPKIRPFFLQRKKSPTIVKRRFVENYFFTKLLELYEINDGAVEASDNQALCETLRRELPKYDGVIVVDYGHGMLTPEAIKIICDEAHFLSVNAQSNAGNLGYHSILRYPRADYLCMAENEMRLEARDRSRDLKQLILEVAQKMKCDRVTVTRGKHGSLCYKNGEGFFEIPAFAGQVLDRMGAGDSFLSLTALGMVQKAPTEVVGFIGNVAGAQAVATVGHRKSVEPAPLFKHIESLLKY